MDSIKKRHNPRPALIAAEKVIELRLNVTSIVEEYKRCSEWINISGPQWLKQLQLIHNEVWENPKLEKTCTRDRRRKEIIWAAKIEGYKGYLINLPDIPDDNIIKQIREDGYLPESYRIFSEKKDIVKEVPNIKEIPTSFKNYNSNVTIQQNIISHEIKQDVLISPSEQRIIQIDITNICPNKCSNCTRLCGQPIKHYSMDSIYFKNVVDSLDGYTGMVGMMGGEPTLHPQFDVLSIYLNSKRPDPQRGNERYFATENWNETFKHLFSLRPFKKGLWTSLGPGYRKHYELINDLFRFQCINDHKDGSNHSALLLPRKELGVSDEEWIKYRNNCWIQRLWSSAVTTRGAYFCEVAASLANLFDGPDGWKIEPEWWKRNQSEFGDQLEMCEYCSACLPVPSLHDFQNTDLVTPNMEKKLISLGSTKKMKVVKENIEQLKIKFKENYKDDPYMKDSDGIRVHKNNGLEVGNLIAIIVCRGYDDYLNLTLKRTMEEFSRVIVITSTKDLATKDIVEKYGAELFTTTILDSDDFKKGTSINECLKTLPKDSWVIVCDADIIFQKGFGTRISNLILNPGALYYVTRIGPQMIEWKVSRHIAQLALKTDDWGLIEETIGIKGNYPVGPWGYTQIFNLSSSIFKEHQEEYYPSNSNDAELDDSEIAIKWFKTSRCVYLNDKKYYVLHLPHGYNKINWKGRISPRLDDDHWWINDNTECLWHRSFRSGPQYLGLTEMCEWLKLPEDSVVIEIGTMMGDSSLIFGHEFKNHRIITVDPGPTPVMVAEAKKRTALLPNIERWEMYSEDAVKKVIEEKIKVGMVYIDGDHSYDAVKKDIRLWRQLSSIICGHDYGIPRWQGVTDAVHSEIGAPIKVFRDSSWVGIQS